MPFLIMLLATFVCGIIILLVKALLGFIAVPAWLGWLLLILVICAVANWAITR